MRDHGDAYIACRAFSGQGSVVKIAADPDDCVDRNGNGRIVSVSDGQGRSVGYAYDANGDLTTITDVMGGTIASTRSVVERALMHNQTARQTSALQKIPSTSA